MATYDRDLGLVTAYGYAKAAGYTGTEEEFAQALSALEVPTPVSKGGTGATSLDDAGILTKDGVQISPGHKFFGGMTVFGDTPMVRFFRDDASFANTSRFYNIQASSKVVNNKRVINRPQFVAYSYDSTTGDQNNYYENYYLPPITPDRTANVDYAVLTSKTPVTVGQGGTGMTGKTALTLTRTENAYVDSESFARLHVYKWGKVISIHFNLVLSAEMPTTSNYVEIGRISNFSIPYPLYANIPAPSDGSKVMIAQITSTGIINILGGSYPLPRGFYRGQLTAIES